MHTQDWQSHHQFGREKHLNWTGDSYQAETFVLVLIVIGWALSLLHRLGNIQGLNQLILVFVHLSNMKLIFRNLEMCSGYILMNLDHLNIDMIEDINGLIWISQDIYLHFNVKLIDKQNGH